MFHHTRPHHEAEDIAATCPHCGGAIPITGEAEVRCDECRKPFRLALVED